MQGGLIRHGSKKKRVAVFVQGDGQAVEPCRPLGIQMSLDADFVERNILGRLVNHRFLSVIRLKDTAGRGETSSPDDVIEVVIDGNKNSSGQGWSWVERFKWLEQVELFRAADGRPTIVDPQFIENILGVGTQGVE